MVTIKDVAYDAQVSTATVSRVLNNDAKVTDETRKAVTTSISKLNYRLYPAARNLKKGKSHTIGVVVPELSNFFFMGLLECFEQSLRKAGYSMMLCSSNNSIDEEMERLDYLQNQFVEGIIVIPVSLEYKHFEQVQKTIPLVFVDRSFDGIRADSVLVNNIDGTCDVVTALIHDGLKKIAFIGGDKNSMTSQERYVGYVKAHENEHIPLQKHFTVMTGTTMQGGYEAMDKMLRLPIAKNNADAETRPDAFFCINLMATLGAAKRIMEESAEVQKTIVLAAFDEIYYASLISWGRYFVAQPVREMGETAARLILERIEKPDCSDFKEIRLPTKIIKYDGTILETCVK